VRSERRLLGSADADTAERVQAQLSKHLVVTGLQEDEGEGGGEGMAQALAALQAQVASMRDAVMQEGKEQEQEEADEAAAEAAGDMLDDDEDEDDAAAAAAAAPAAAAATPPAAAAAAAAPAVAVAVGAASGGVLPDGALTASSNAAGARHGRLHGRAAWVPQRQAEGEYLQVSTCRRRTDASRRLLRRTLTAPVPAGDTNRCSDAH
jgi:hypothetical protein